MHKTIIAKHDPTYVALYHVMASGPMGTAVPLLSYQLFKGEGEEIWQTHGRMIWTAMYDKRDFYRKISTKKK